MIVLCFLLVLLSHYRVAFSGCMPGKRACYSVPAEERTEKQRLRIERDELITILNIYTTNPFNSDGSSLYIFLVSDCVHSFYNNYTKDFAFLDPPATSDLSVYESPTRCPGEYGGPTYGHRVSLDTDEGCRASVTSDGIAGLTCGDLDSRWHRCRCAKRVGCL